jgi:hypothetical protein
MSSFSERFCYRLSDQTAADPRTHIRFFFGTWAGISSGQSDRDSVTILFEFVLGGEFLQVKKPVVISSAVEKPERKRCMNF